MTLADFLTLIRRYLTVGALCALVYNVIMIGSDFAGMHYLPATLLSFAVVAPLGYFLHCRFTFGKALSLEGLLRFVAGLAVAYPLLLGLMMLFCSGIGMPVLIASPLATVVLVAFNYLSARWAIVRRLRHD